MKIKNIINWFNPFKRAWWWERDWIPQDSYNVYEIIQKNNECSWDIEIYSVVLYKHKHTCEGRVKIEKDICISKTVFENPAEKYPQMENIERVKVYDGPKYD